MPAKSHKDYEREAGFQLADYRYRYGSKLTVISVRGEAEINISFKTHHAVKHKLIPKHANNVAWVTLQSKINY